MFIGASRLLGISGEKDTINNHIKMTIMKNRNLFLGITAMFAAASGFVSCTNEVEDVQNAGGCTPITLVSNVSGSRGANADLQKTQIAKDVNIGVFVNGTAGLIENGGNNRLAADGAGGFTGGNTMYYPEDGSAVSVYAYAPYADGWSLDGTNEFTVASDQSTDRGYLASDLLYGTPDSNPVTSSAEPVSIRFGHKLSKLNINFDAGETGVDLKGATVSVLNTRPSTTLDLKDGALGTASGTAAEIKAAVFADDASTFLASAVIVPQTIAAGQFVRIVTAGNDTYNAELTSEVTFAERKVYTYTVKFSESGGETTAELVLGSVVDDWEDGNQDLEGEAKLAYSVGDYMKSDGTFVKNAELQDADMENVVAVIFSTDVSETDAIAGYNAYAMGVTLFGSKQWGFTDAIEEGCPTFEQALNNLDGRTKTNMILVSAAYNGIEEKGSSFVNYSNYKNNYPVNSDVSSDWFTPSFGQMMQIMNNLGDAGVTSSTQVEDANNSSMYTSADNAALDKVNGYVTALGKSAILTEPESGSATYITVTENAADGRTNCWCIQTGADTWSFGKNAGKGNGNRSVIPCVAVRLPDSVE